MKKAAQARASEKPIERQPKPQAENQKSRIPSIIALLSKELPLLEPGNSPRIVRKRVETEHRAELIVAICKEYNISAKELAYLEQDYPAYRLAMLPLPCFSTLPEFVESYGQADQKEKDAYLQKKRDVQVLE